MVPRWLVDWADRKKPPPHRHGLSTQVTDGPFKNRSISTFAALVKALGRRGCATTLPGCHSTTPSCAFVRRVGPRGESESEKDA